MKPRVLFVDHVGVLGGAELSLLDIARHHRARSRVVLFEDGPFRERLEAAGVRVTVLPAPDALQTVGRDAGWWSDLTAVPGVLGQAWALARQARRYDLLYANSQKAMVVSALAGVLAGRPVVWHLRDLMSADHFSGLHRRATAWISTLFADRVIANSDATRDAFVRNGGPAGRTFTVHNGIDPAPFEEAVPAEGLRQELGVAEDVPLVGVFSRLAAWKGQHVLVEALGQVPEAHAVLVGDALFPEDRAYADRLRRQAREQGVAGRVHFLGFRSDVPALLKTVDVVAHTSTAPEPFGRVIVEGMLAEKPVVATRAGGAAEVLADPASGVLVAPGRAEELARALRHLLARPAEARTMAIAGRRRAEKHFTTSRLLQALDRHLHELAPV